MYGVDLLELTQDRELRTPEIHTQNDFYGNAAILKRYAGLPSDYSLKTVVEHSPMYPGVHWHVDMEAHMPGFITSSPKSLSYIYKKSKKLGIAIGPCIAYAQSTLSDKEKDFWKKKLKKNLLVYLPHSSHHTDVNYDENSVLEKIHYHAKTFDSVSICIFWKDMDEKKISKYQSYGYYVVSCGHMFDQKFMDRQLSLLQLSDCVLSFGYLSVLIYAAYMNKMICIEQPKNYERQHDVIDTIAVNKIPSSYARQQQRWFESLARLCTTPSHLSPDIRELFSFVGGFNQVKTPEYLRKIFRITEDSYFLKYILNSPTFPEPDALIKFYIALGLEERIDALKNITKSMTIEST